MVKLILKESSLEVIGHGTDETCSRVSQFIYDIEVMYFLINKNLYLKQRKEGKIFFEKGHSLITWDYTLDFTLHQFIKFVAQELKTLYPNTIEFENYTIN